MIESNYLRYTMGHPSHPNQTKSFAVRSDSALTYDPCHLSLIREAMTRRGDGDAEEFIIHAVEPLIAGALADQPPMRRKEGFTVWDITHLCQQ